MKRILAMLVLLVAACGGAPSNPEAAPTADATVATAAESGDASQSDAPAASADEAAPDASAAPSPDDEPSGTSTRERPDGPMAPEFELALGEGGTFTLAGEARPVYIVFWAEW